MKVATLDSLMGELTNVNEDPPFNGDHVQLCAVAWALLEHWQS
jgi:hypothetical protein